MPLFSYFVNESFIEALIFQEIPLQWKIPRYVPVLRNQVNNRPNLSRKVV